jgi:hypothetical protein
MGKKINERDNGIQAGKDNHVPVDVLLDKEIIDGTMIALPPIADSRKPLFKAGFSGKTIDVTRSGNTFELVTSVDDNLNKENIGPPKVTVSGNDVTIFVNGKIHGTASLPPKTVHESITARFNPVTGIIVIRGKTGEKNIDVIIDT